MDAQIIEAILKTTSRSTERMRKVLRVLLEGGPRSRNVITGLCADKGATLDKLLALELLVMKGAKRNATYDVSPRVRAAAKLIPELNPAQ